MAVGKWVRTASVNLSRSFLSSGFNQKPQRMDECPISTFNQLLKICYQNTNLSLDVKFKRNKKKRRKKSRVPLIIHHVRAAQRPPIFLIAQTEWTDTPLVCAMKHFLPFTYMMKLLVTEVIWMNQYHIGMHSTSLLSCSESLLIWHKIKE